MNIKHTLSMLLMACCASAANAQSAYIDKYITGTVTLTTIGSSANQVSQPRDLDFKPNSNELWVCNNGNSQGGSMVIFYNTGLPNQSSQYRKDSHTGHFKVYPSAIAFGDDGYWANTNEIKNTASASSTFMGPALWTGDTAIFARVFQNDWVPGLPLGSHYDMLHQSPFSMGIAHDTLMAYWVYDGYNGNICKYDFVKHHGPGYDNHSAGKIWRYTDVPVTMVTGVPSHMVMDKKTGWLYYIEGGGKSLRRLNTKTGTEAGTLTVPSSGGEPLAGYWRVNGATVERLDSFPTQPCGIDFYDNRLIVSDYTNGNIYLYNTDPVVTLVKTISTGRPGMMGVKFGPDSRIWCVNRPDNKVYRLDIDAPAVDASLITITAPKNVPFMKNFYSTGYNICEGTVAPAVNVMNKGTSAITSMDLQYTIDNGTLVPFAWTGSIAAGGSSVITLPSSSVTGGSHTVNISVSGVNGNPDEIAVNNHISGSFRVVASATTPFSEAFATTTFPPAGWNYIGYNPNNQMGYSTAGGHGNNTGSLRMTNFSGQEDITGQIDYFMSPAINFSGANAQVRLKFNMAYAQYSDETNDQLRVLASTDCGETWSVLYDKSGSQLATAPDAATSWLPAAAQWRFESVPLSSFAGQSKVILMFSTTSNFGNNVYIDDIRVDNTTGIAEAYKRGSLFNIYPNPSTGMTTISLIDEINEDLNGAIYSFDGKMVKSFHIGASENSVSLDLSELPAGIYAIKLTNGTDTFTHSVIRQ